ncbi:MAG TPA: 1,2-phenylacetyl-CoA epoxidase subunit PaaD [Chryseosolibacter sp.]|nr:1,2-phenylacetyl-CoA epoxidase subunit PaaD [Chryseosolibacter sp.]
MQKVTADNVYSWLREVKDPEIPVLSLVDLGVINEVDVDGNAVRVVITPTFVGCPALDIMQTDIRSTLRAKGFTSVEIEVSYKTPWTSDKISPEGKEALRKFGLAPPPSRQLFSDLDVLAHATCPRCGNNNTELRNVFGTTLCRSIHYCNQCKEGFEQFKPI